jgi:hypothetical protein
MDWDEVAFLENMDWDEEAFLGKLEAPLGNMDLEEALQGNSD